MEATEASVTRERGRGNREVPTFITCSNTIITNTRAIKHSTVSLTQQVQWVLQITYVLRRFNCPILIEVLRARQFVNFKNKFHLRVHWQLIFFADVDPQLHSSHDFKSKSNLTLIWTFCPCYNLQVRCRQTAALLTRSSWLTTWRSSTEFSKQKVRLDSLGDLEWVNVLKVLNKEYFTKETDE